MKSCYSGLAVLVLLMSFFLILPSSIHCAADGEVNTQITHTPPGYYIPGFRIILDADVKDDNGILVARCYFKTKKDDSFVFMDMALQKESAYQVTLPAPWVQSESIEYLFVTVNKDKKVWRSESFTMEEKETEQAASWTESADVKELRLDRAQEVMEQYQALREDLRKEHQQKLPDWQIAQLSGPMMVFSELQPPLELLVGFFDQVTMTPVPVAAKYGFLAEGIYSQEELAAVGGKSTVATNTGATTTAATTTGAASASVGGIGLGTIAVPAAAVVVGGVVLAGNSSSDDSSGGTGPAGGGTGTTGGGAALFATVLPPNGNANPCCDLEVLPLLGAVVPLTIEHPGMATTNWNGMSSVSFNAVGRGTGRMTLTNDVTGGRIQIHFPSNGGRANLTINGKAGDYFQFQTQ